MREAQDIIDELDPDKDQCIDCKKYFSIVDSEKNMIMLTEDKRVCWPCFDIRRKKIYQNIDEHNTGTRYKI